MHPGKSIDAWVLGSDGNQEGDELLMESTNLEKEKFDLHDSVVVSEFASSSGDI